MNFAIFTLGCKVNTYQSEGIAAELEHHGHIRAEADLDLVIINTCTVTGRAAQKGRRLIRNLRTRYPQARLVVIGCDTAVGREALEAMPEADEILAYQDKYRLAQILAGEGAGPSPGLFPFRVPAARARTRGLIMVQDGCDAFCSYCILPHIRGPLASRPLADIIAEARSQAENGVPEIVITGIHTGAYGRDLAEDIGLAEVCRALLDLPGRFRIRLSSIEIQEVDERLLDLMAAEERFCAHLPVPLQSGSDRILHRMNRGYTAGQFLKAVRRIRMRLPDCGLTTDIMCGFPGETDDDFQQSADLAEQAGFTRIHAFKYSKRPGTPAAAMPDQVPEQIKGKRVKVLAALGHRLKQAFAQTFVGRQLAVIPESLDKGTGLLTGYSHNYIQVQFAANPDLIGRIIKVRGLQAKEGLLRAEPL